MVNIRYHHCAYASRASMAQRDNRSDMGPIFMSGGMRTGSQYGGIAKDHRHGDQGYNHTNRNANRSLMNS